jgi:predicted CXXCH cytochrome family protein
MTRRLRRFWASVRPRTRRGRVIAAAAVAGGAVVLAIAIFAGAAMAWDPYLDFALHPDSNAKQWAALDMTFADSSVCASCHHAEAGRLDSNAHSGIGCQSCHGPLLAHAEAGQNASKSDVLIKVPTDEVCVRCHAAAEGRPAAFKTIVPADHYVGQCLQCHDPHTSIAEHPPVVSHPLDNLPPCLTCHGPDGFKARNQRHPTGLLTDQECLLCHAEGRGPEMITLPVASGQPQPSEVTP